MGDGDLSRKPCEKIFQYFRRFVGRTVVDYVDESWTKSLCENGLQSWADRALPIACNDDRPVGHLRWPIDHLNWRLSDQTQFPPLRTPISAGPGASIDRQRPQVNETHISSCVHSCRYTLYLGRPIYDPTQRLPRTMIYKDWLLASLV